MNTVTIAAVIISSAGALIVGMAIIIKIMVLGLLNEIKCTLSEVVKEYHDLNLRVTVLETERKMLTCLTGRRRITDDCESESEREK